MDIDIDYGKYSAEQAQKIKNFIDYLKSYTKQNGIKLLIVNTPGVPYAVGSGMLVNGYFDDATSTLACATGKDITQWLPVLIHESSHMDQFLEQVSAWTENLDLKETDKWLEGDNNVDMERVSNEIKTGIQVELDCEKRTVEKIKKWGLEFVVSINEYIQKANAYILFYNWMKENRRWYEIGYEPYNIPDIVSQMPKSFDTDYSKLTDELRQVFDKLKTLPNKSNELKEDLKRFKSLINYNLKQGNIL